MLRRAGEGAVQVDDMQFLSALLGPVPGLRRRVVAVDRHVFGAPLPEPHALAVLQVDGGQDDHITPFEDGTPFSFGSTLTAARSARAKLLKSPSQTWWASSP